MAPYKLCDYDYHYDDDYYYYYYCIVSQKTKQKMFQIVTQRCKNPKNSRQQRILTHSIQDNEN